MDKGQCETHILSQRQEQNEKLQCMRVWISDIVPQTPHIMHRVVRKVFYIKKECDGHLVETFIPDLYPYFWTMICTSLNTL